MKNFLKLFGIVALAVVIGFTFVACDDGGGYGPGGGPSSYNPGGGGGGWPSSSVLSKWGISGFNPTGASGYYWGEVSEGLVIMFNGTSATDQAVQRYFSNNGWSQEGNYESSDGTMLYYSKSPYFASYVRSTGSGAYTYSVTVIRD